MSTVNKDAYRFFRQFWAALEAYSLACGLSDIWPKLASVARADLEYLARTARPVRRKDHWGPRQGFTLAARQLTLRELTDKQLERLANNVYTRIARASSGGRSFGIDWPTLRAALPCLANTYRAVHDEIERRELADLAKRTIGRTASERRAVRARLAATLKTNAKSLCKPLPTVIELTSYGSREYSIYQGEVDQEDGEIMILR